MATRTPSSSPTPSTRTDDNLPIIIAAAAGGGAILLILSAIVACFVIQRKKRRKSEKVFLRGRKSTIAPGVASGVPLRYVVTTTVGAAAPRTSMATLDPTAKEPDVPPPRKSEIEKEKRPRPSGVHARYQSPYSAMALEKVYETLERNITSPVPSFLSGRSEGINSGIASARASSELNHGRAFRSFDTPPASTARPSFSQGYEGVFSGRPGTGGSRPGTSGSRPGTGGSLSRPRSWSMAELPSAMGRRPSEVKRDLLAALESTEVVEVVRRPELSYAFSPGSNAPSAFRDPYRPP